MCQLDECYWYIDEMVVLDSPACWYLKGNAGFGFWSSAFDHTRLQEYILN